MKNILIIFILFFSGCYMQFDDYYSDLAAGHELYYYFIAEHCANQEIKNIDQIACWINGEIKYKAEKNDVWSNPQETIERGYGDCDDACILFMNFAYLYLGEKWNILIVHNTNEKTEVDGGRINHTVVENEHGQIYEIYLRQFVEYSKIGYRYTFDEVFND